MGEGPPIRALQTIPAQSSLTLARHVPELPGKGLDWCFSVISFFLFVHHVTCRILVLQLGTESRSLAVKARSPNHWTSREVPPCHF